MTFRIDRIKVKRAGPLESDFEFEPGDLNLIYGNNETGKTYVVESLIRFLFKTNKGAPVARNLRGWDIAGKAIVSGLKSDPVTFTMSGQKLEDYWEDGLGLPRDLARLLVVRAGETLLAEEVDDGDGEHDAEDGSTEIDEGILHGLARAQGADKAQNNGGHGVMNLEKNEAHHPKGHQQGGQNDKTREESTFKGVLCFAHDCFHA